MTSKATNEDCMELMARYTDKYFDLAIVDPPYGIGLVKTKAGNWGIRKNGDGEATSENTKWDFAPPEPEYFEQLFRVSKNQIIWGANHFIERINKNSSCWIVWDKKNGASYFADAELAWTSFKTATRIVKKNNINPNRVHLTQKPVYLYDWLLKNYAKEGDKILDTHLGSGSSRIACDRAGLEFTGCELDKDYFDAQEKWFKQYKSQRTLF